MGKIIFLDFHGPLGNNRTWFQNGNDEDYDKSFVKFLNYACEMFGAKVVSISDHGGIDNPKEKREAFFFLERAGFNNDHFHDDWSAFGLAKGITRKAPNIEKWLENHPEIHRDHCLAIEDGGNEKLHSIWVDTFNGVTYKQYWEIAGFLGLDLIEIEQRNKQDHKEQIDALHKQIDDLKLTPD